MKKLVFLTIMLFIGSIVFAQNKEHKTYVVDKETPTYGYRDDRIPCVLTMSYYEDENGTRVYDGPFSIVGKETVPSYEVGVGACHVDVLYEMYGNYTNGKLDGKYSLKRKYNLKTDKGVIGPNEWVTTGCFMNGVPTGEWNCSYKKEQPKSSTHFTIKDGKLIGKFYSRGFEITDSGSATNGMLESYEEKFRGETTRKYTYYKGVDISNNADVAKKYADGKITVEELEDKGYYVVEEDIKVLSGGNVFRSDFLAVFDESLLQQSLDRNYWGNWLSAKGSRVIEITSPFWSPAKVNAYIEKIQKIDSYDYNYDKGLYSISYYKAEPQNLYNSHQIKTAQYKKIQEAFDKRKAELEQPIVEKLKQAINATTSMDELNSLMKSNSELVGLFFDDNKDLINEYAKIKANEIEDKYCNDVIEAIKSTFDITTINAIKTNYPKKDEYKAFSKENRKRIDDVLAKQGDAIIAYDALQKALNKIVEISKDKKIVKKTVETVSNDYAVNVSSWEVFKGNTRDLPNIISDFCPMSNYSIKSVDYLQDGSYSFKVVWTKQISKKEQKKHVSYFVVLNDKKHVDLNSFDFSKAENK